MAERRVKSEEELKQQLEDALKKLRPHIAEAKSHEPLLGKYEKLAARPEEAKAVENKKDKSKPLGLDGLAKKGNALEKKAKEAGIDFTRPSKEKDDKAKEDEKKKEKEKENTKNNPKQKSEILNTISLPQGAHIVEHANKWEIVTKDKNGQEVATDITEVMNTIDNYNKGVNEVNKTRQAMSQPQISNQTKENAVLPSLKNLYSEEGKAVYKAPENVTPKDIPVFQSEEQMRAFANKAYELSNADKLYKKLNDRENDNTRSKDEQNLTLSKLSERGGR